MKLLESKISESFEFETEDSAREYVAKRAAEMLAGDYVTGWTLESYRPGVRLNIVHTWDPFGAKKERESS